MKKKLCFFLVLCLLAFIPYKIKAVCDDDEYIRLSNLAQNVKTSYVYNEKNKTFSVIITNLKKELTIRYLNKNVKYTTDKELIINNLYSGKHSFMIYANNDKCTNEYFITKYVELPFYNFYYNSNQCKGIENYYYCTKWLNTNISSSDFVKKTSEYKEKINKQKKISNEKKDTHLENRYFTLIKTIYIENYTIILPAIIAVLCLIIYIKNKKSNII